MKITLDDYRCKLINKILFASSQEEVMRFVETAMKSLASHMVHGHVIARFVEKTIRNLEEFSATKENAQQRVNIQYAKMQFYKINGAVKTS